MTKIFHANQGESDIQERPMQQQLKWHLSRPDVLHDAALKK